MDCVLQAMYQGPEDAAEFVSTSTCGEHFSAVEILLHKEERALKKPKEEVVISGAVCGLATPISCVNVACGFSQKSSNSKSFHDHI